MENKIRTKEEVLKANNEWAVNLVQRTYVDTQATLLFTECIMGVIAIAGFMAYLFV